MPSIAPVICDLFFERLPTSPIERTTSCTSLPASAIWVARLAKASAYRALSLFFYVNGHAQRKLNNNKCQVFLKAR